MFDQLIQSWSDPHTRHAMLVHLPIVLGGLGIVPLIAFFATGFKSPALRLVCIAWFLAASAGAGLAASAGEAAEERLEANGPALAADEERALHRHEELGEGGWIWPLIPASLTALTFVRPKPLRFGAGTLALAASVVVGVWIANTAHAGGELVYRYGLGVPPRGGSAAQTPGAAGATPAPNQSPEHEDDD